MSTTQDARSEGISRPEVVCIAEYTPHEICSALAMTSYGHWHRGFFEHTLSVSVQAPGLRESRVSCTSKMQPVRTLYGPLGCQQNEMTNNENKISTTHAPSESTSTLTLTENP